MGVVMGGLQAIEANNQAKAIRRQAEFQAMQAKFNEEILNLKKRDLADIASGEITKRQKQTKQIIGSQKVAMASQGIDVDSELAMDLETEEYKLSQEDEMTIKNNAWREALGLEIEQSSIRNQSMFDQAFASSQARSTRDAGYMQGAGTALNGIMGYAQSQQAKRISREQMGRE